MYPLMYFAGGYLRLVECWFIITFVPLHLVERVIVWRVHTSCLLRFDFLSLRRMLYCWNHRSEGYRFLYHKQFFWFCHCILGFRIVAKMSWGLFHHSTLAYNWLGENYFGHKTCQVDMPISDSEILGCFLELNSSECEVWECLALATVLKTISGSRDGCTIEWRVCRARTFQVHNVRHDYHCCIGRRIWGAVRVNVKSV